jgi:Domain of unknown function (DU1801)
MIGLPSTILTFAKGAALQDSSGLFNSSLDGNVRRAIDINEGDKVDEAALKELIRAAVASNLRGKSNGQYGGPSATPQDDGEKQATAKTRIKARAKAPG